MLTGRVIGELPGPKDGEGAGEPAEGDNKCMLHDEARGESVEVGDEMLFVPSPPRML